MGGRRFLGEAVGIRPFPDAKGRKKRFSGVRAVGGRGGLRGMRGRLDDRGSSDATEGLRVREPLAAYSGTGNGLLAGLGFWVAGGPSWGGARPQHSWDRGWELAGGKPPLIFCWRWFRETVSSGPTGSVPSGYPPPWGPWPPGPAWSGFSPSGACPSSISYPAGRGYREMARNSIPACLGQGVRESALAPAPRSRPSPWGSLSGPRVEAGGWNRVAGARAQPGWPSGSREGRDSGRDGDGSARWPGSTRWRGGSGRGGRTGRSVRMRAPRRPIRE